jgi:hypothetical protein
VAPTVTVTAYRGACATGTGCVSRSRVKSFLPTGARIHRNSLQVAFRRVASAVIRATLGSSFIDENGGGLGGAATKTAIKKALESGSIWARKYKTNPIWLGALGDRPTSRRGHQHNFAPELECTASRDSLVGGHHGVVGIFCFGLFPWLVCWSASFGRRFGALARRQS